MEVRTGIDLVDVVDVDSALARWGDRYLARVLTRSELASCTTASGRIRTRQLAAVLAAKEATFKVLSAGDDQLPWTCVEVAREGGGEMSIRLSGAARAIAERDRIDSLSVSVTSRQDHAGAVVLAELRPPNTKDVDTQ